MKLKPEFPADFQDPIPPYEFQHNGTVLVLGFAWTLHDDVFEAKNWVGSDVDVCAVNDAATVYPAQHVFSAHKDKLGDWVGVQRRRFNQYALCHSAHWGGRHKASHFPWVDYWWKSCPAAGTSVWGAAKMCLAMGYERVVLCGAPLEPGPYASGKQVDCYRPGASPLYNWQQAIMRDEWMKPFVRSMSGWTREYFGGLDG